MCINKKVTVTTGGRAAAQEPPCRGCKMKCGSREAPSAQTACQGNRDGSGRSSGPSPALAQGEVRLRAARKDDVPALVGMLKSFAEFEGVPAMLEVTPDRLMTGLFPLGAEPPLAVATIAEVVCDNSGPKIGGFTVHAFTFSTFLGRPTLHVEDLYVEPWARGFGLGKMLFKNLCTAATMRNCGRIDWYVLAWNNRARAFYEGLGGRPRTDTVAYRLSADRYEMVAG